MKHLRPNLALLLALLISVSAVGCSPGNAKLVSAPTPDQAIEQMAHSIADGRFDAAWQALPPSYQNDITEVVHLGASEMDAELWNRTFTVLQKTTRILSEKRNFILDHPMLAAEITPQSIDIIKQAFTMQPPVRISVNGEEDLLVIPVCVYAPENAIVLYGQPNEWNINNLFLN